MERITPHERIDMLYKRNKKAFDKGLSATVMVVDNMQRMRDHKVALSTPKENKKLIDGYLDLLGLGLRSNIHATDMGLWIQGFFQLFDRHERA